jgi:hypothetical protein
VDLGGIAKGYTAQLAAIFLGQWGPCLVDAGGDLDPAEEAVLLEIRSALRGRSQDEIAAVVPSGADRALASLVARGAVVRRGARYFPA